MKLGCRFQNIMSRDLPCVYLKMLLYTQDSPLYIFCESYGGKMASVLGREIVKACLTTITNMFSVFL